MTNTEKFEKLSSVGGAFIGVALKNGKKMNARFVGPRNIKKMPKMVTLYDRWNKKARKVHLDSIIGINCN